MSSGEDVSEKTSIVSGDTFSGKMQQAEQTPPALVVLMGPSGYVGRQWSLTLSEYVVGRNPDSTIFVDDKSVSRSHARLMVVGSEVTIQDLGSSNKTAINGTVLTPMTSQKLKNNDQVKCGSVILKFLERGNLEAFTNKQMTEKAEKDALTGAYNKGALLERGPEVMKRSELLKEELSIIVFDIDFFKKINDGHGHPGGDYVLKTLGQIVSSKLIRANDYFARYGGEEFVLILSGAPQKNAMEVAERVRTTIESSVFEFEGKRIPVTVSLGVATRGDETAWEVLFDRADKALYQSKQNGRNRVTLSP
jgi:two-component system, cell cycle response regulator